MGAVRFAETAILWFGRVDATHNWADLRVGYNGDGLYLCLAAFDRRLWYDTDPSLSDLERWDAVTFYLRTSAGAGASPGPDDYRFVAQLNWWETRPAYQAAYRGGASGWAPAAIPFTTASGWRGNAPNDDQDDRGWVATLHIPFSSLGLSGAPAPGSAWSLGVALHDRDDAAGTAIADQIWPPGMQPQQPPTWGELAFGMPSYSPPAAAPGGIVVVRQGLNGATVPDAAVGGTTGNLCPGDSDYIWNHWGDASFAAVADFNIQNQGDVADWPCFARYYVTFPLDALPAGQAIISATLTLHQWGNSGGPRPGRALAHPGVDGERGLGRGDAHLEQWPSGQGERCRGLGAAAPLLPRMAGRGEDLGCLRGGGRGLCRRTPVAPGALRG